jgi:PAS domain S-box-containing protein
MRERGSAARATPPRSGAARIPRWTSWLPAAFVSLYLALLGLVFLWQGRRIEARQAVIQELIRPSRERLLRVQRALALGIAASTAYAARAEPGFAAAFAAAEAEIGALERELRGLAGRLGGGIPGALERFVAARERWTAGQRALVRARASPAEFRSQLVAQQEVIHEVAEAAARLEATLDSRVMGLMAEIRGIEALRRWIVGAGALVALVAALAAVWFSERSRRLAEALDARRRTMLEQERAAHAAIATLLESITDAFLAIDRDGRFTYVNRRAEELCGTPRESPLGRPAWEAVSETVGESAGQALERALRERSRVAFESTAPVGGRWFEGIAYPAPDGGATMLFRDISERKRAERERTRLLAAVEWKQRLLEAVVQQMPAGVIVVEAPSGRILIGNRQVDRIWRARLSGARHIEQYRPLKMYHPDGRRYTTQQMPLVRALVEGEEVEAEEIDILRGDGSRATIRASAAPVRDEHGRIVAAVTAFHDVTRQRRLEQGLRLLSETGRVFMSSLDYESTLRAAVRLSVPRLADWSTVHLVEPGERTTRVLETAHADPARRSLLERLLRRFPRGLDAMQPIAEAIRTGKPQFTPDVDETALVRAIPDRRLRELVAELGIRSGMVLPLRVGDHVLGAFAFAYAESGRRYGQEEFDLAQELVHRASMAVHNALLYREAQQALRARDDVLAIVSHDLRNPLHTIHATVELVLDLWPSREQQEQHLEAVLRAARRMDRLIQDLLDVSRIQAGKSLKIEPSSEPPAKLVRGAAEAFRAAAQEKGVRMDVHAPDDLPPVRADESRIHQVLSNLLANAVKFTPPGGHVSVSADAVPEGIRFSVRDTGPGIAPEDLEHIFQPFWQVRRTARLGVGLGLGIARGIVEQHGGRIWVESRPGAGSTFSFTLPLARREETRAA